MDKLPTDELERRASRVATIGIIACLVLTMAGMLIRSPVLGGLGLFGLAAVVILRRPIARLLGPR